MAPSIQLLCNPRGYISPSQPLFLNLNYNCTPITCEIGNIYIYILPIKISNRPLHVTFTFVIYFLSYLQHLSTYINLVVVPGMNLSGSLRKWHLSGIQRLTNLNFLHRNINAYGIQNLNRLLLIIMYIDSSGHCWERAVKFSIISFTNYEEGCSVCIGSSGWLKNALTTLRAFIILICRLRHRTTVYLFHNTLKVNKCDHFKLLIVICSNCQTKAYI